MVIETATQSKLSRLNVFNATQCSSSTLQLVAVFGCSQNAPGSTSRGSANTNLTLGPQGCLRTLSQHTHVLCCTNNTLPLTGDYSTQLSSRNSPEAGIGEWGVRASTMRETPRRRGVSGELVRLADQNATGAYDRHALRHHSSHSPDLQIMNWP